MKDRTEALRRLEEETRRARERFEQEACKHPSVWEAYQRDLVDPIGHRFWSDMEKCLEHAPELHRLWSDYIRFKSNLKSALSRPSWPGILADDDPTPPSGKKKAG